jgi:hypothetical protein
VTSAGEARSILKAEAETMAQVVKAAHMQVQ